LRGEAAVPQAPAVVVAPDEPGGAAAPDVVVPAAVAEPLGEAPLPVVDTGLSTRGCPHPVAARLSLSVVASMLLHAGAAAAFVWLSLAPPPPISAGEEGIPVELVVAADTGSAAQHETASGRDETQSAATQSEARQRIEAPPAETPPEPAAAEPEETAAAEPPVAQPDPLTTAQRILDQLPPPPMPDHLPVIDRPAEPVLAEARSEPVRDDPPPQPEVQPAPAPEPAPVAETPPPPQPVTPQKAETQEPTEVQAAVAPPPVEPPPPAAVVQPMPQVTPVPPVQRAERPRPPARHEATRPPPTRRVAPPTRERVRPTREAAAAPRPERPARAARQAESRASIAERGEGTGQRNRQQSSATGTSGASSVAAVAAWRQRVLAHLARFKVYPEQARDRGIRGRTGIAFTLTGSGAVASVSIASSSGAPILDQATLAMVRRAQPFPPNPAGGSASFTAGVNYSLH
jgi:protein TonB